MVHLVKDRQPNTTTLAIGDGANDVNMITSAHIGIGILGVEGRQAARASDYSIAQFQYLKRLLFVHGRESYRKNSYVVCYNFYKNCLFVMPQFWFGFSSYFSGQTLYDPWIYQFFNIIYSCLPIIWFGIYDKEVSYDTLMRDTRYYVQGIIGKLFHSLRFWKWVIYGMMQGVLVYLFSYHANFGPYDQSGHQQDLFSAGSIAYSGIVLIVNVKILMSTYTHSFVSFILFFYSVATYYLTMSVMSKSYRFENFNNYKMITLSTNFYLSSFILVMVCILLDIGVKRILLAFGIIVDPLEVHVDDNHETIIELKPTVVIQNTVIDTEINNNCNIIFLIFSHWSCFLSGIRTDSSDQSMISIIFNLFK
jgi:phospholipid-transporting ATPase